MKKKILDQLNKIKNKFEDITNATKEEDITPSHDYIIKYFSDNNSLPINREVLENLNFYYKQNNINVNNNYNTHLTNLLNNNLKLTETNSDNSINLNDIANNYSSTHNSNEILLVAVVGFHHKKGSIVEYTYPSKEEIIKTNFEYLKDLIDFEGCEAKKVEDAIEDILNQLTFFCLPDMVHMKNEDAQFFFIQNYKSILYGISCYKQVKTNSQELDDENTRHCVQKAICIVTKLPLFGQMHSKLKTTVSVFFNQNTLKDKQIIEQLYTNLDSLSYKNINIYEILISFSLRKLLMFCKDKIFQILKFVFLEKKIIVYSQISNNVCSFILSLISLIPGSSIFNISQGSSIKNYQRCLASMGFPLKLYHAESKIFPLFTLFEFSKIEKLKSFLIGTTNQIVLDNNKMKYDLIINLDTNKILFSNDIPEKIYKNSKEEKNVISSVISKLKSNFNEKSEDWLVNMQDYDPNFEGSDDYIRNSFRNYFFNMVVDLSLAKQVIKNAYNGESGKDLMLDSNQDTSKIKSEVLSDEDSDDNGDVLNGSSNGNTTDLIKKQKKETDKKIKKSIKKILERYNVYFLCAWMQTLNFKIWNQEHQENLCSRSFYLKYANNVNIYYENGDVYNGSLSKGMKHGFGIFKEYATGYIYNGHWLNDSKNGSGSYSSPDNKYIYDGEWKDNKKHGQGQLIDNSKKYSGVFKNDLNHGPGILCDEEGNIYEGEFSKGYFEGMGHYKSIEGFTYIGQFHRNKFHGKGQLTEADGIIYNGNFIDNKKSGEGFLMFSNGDRYEGEFLNDVFHGKGILIYVDGREEKGTWKNGVKIN